jgi:hypothetical protein
MANGGTAFDLAMYRWVHFTEDEPLQGRLVHASDLWASITAYVGKNTFRVGETEWVDGCQWEREPPRESALPTQQNLACTSPESSP